MSQSSYTSSLTAYTEGQIAQGRLAKDSQSKTIDNVGGVYPGRACALKNSDGTTCRMPYSNTATIVLDADLVASNVLAGDIVVNGVTTAYTETYATSHLATMTALAAEIAAIDGISACTVGGASNRTLTITADDETDIYVSSGEVTAGGSQAGVTLANTDSLSYYGIAALSGLEPETDNSVVFDDGTAVGLVRKGYIAVRSDDTVVPGSSIAVRFYQESAADKKRGMIMLASNIGTSPVLGKTFSGLTVEKGCAAGGIAIVSLNLP
jgi:hypothetical protein